MNLRACAEVNDTEATSTIPERTIETITGEIRVSQGTLQIRDGTTSTPTVFAAAAMAGAST